MSLRVTKIEWATHTWSPVTGCRHGCPYCYARTMARRFQAKSTEKPSNGDCFAEDESAPGCYILHSVATLTDAGGHSRISPYPFGFSPTLHEYRLDDPGHLQEPARIFVCSVADLFGDWVPDTWIERIFAACERAPQHTYMFLTKSPTRYDDLLDAGKLPRRENFWYGSTLTGPDGVFWHQDGFRTFVSIEPLLRPLGALSECCAALADWVIIGAMTGAGASRHQPEREWVEEIVAGANKYNTPVLMKESLLPIVGEKNMRREFPAAMPVLRRQPRPRCMDCKSCRAEQRGEQMLVRFCQAADPLSGGIRIPGRYARTSPPWCPRREVQE